MFETLWTRTDGTSLLRPFKTSSRRSNKTSWRRTIETSWRRSNETSLGVSFGTYLRTERRRYDVATTSYCRVGPGCVFMLATLILLEPHEIRKIENSVEEKMSIEKIGESCINFWLHYLHPLLLFVTFVMNPFPLPKRLTF